MSDSAIKGDIVLPDMCGGVLPAGPEDGDRAQFVRGCSVIAVNPAEPMSIVYWDVTIDMDNPPALGIVSLMCGGADPGAGFEPPYIPGYVAIAAGRFRLTAYKLDGEGNWISTLEPPFSFKIAFMPNR